MPFGSIGTAASRWFTMRCDDDDVGVVEDAVDRARCPSRWRRSNPCSSCRSGASGSSAASMSATAGQRVVVDDHRLGRVERLRLRLGDHHRDDVADEAHLVARERRPVHRRRQHDEAVVVGEVEVVRCGTRRRRPASTAASSVSIALDPRVRDRRPDERDVQQPVDRRDRRGTRVSPVRMPGSSRRIDRVPENRAGQSAMDSAMCRVPPATTAAAHTNKAA